MGMMPGFESPTKRYDPMQRRMQVKTVIFQKWDIFSNDFTNMKMRRKEMVRKAQMKK